jgi:hypothetical protein
VLAGSLVFASYRAQARLIQGVDALWSKLDDGSDLPARSDYAAPGAGTATPAICELAAALAEPPTLPEGVTCN